MIIIIEYGKKSFYKRSRKLVKIDAAAGREGVLKSVAKKLGLKNS